MKHAAALSAKAQLWALNNPERRRETVRSNYARNPAKHRVRTARYRAAHPEKRQQEKQRRRALKWGNGHETYSRAEVLASNGGRCIICNLPSAEMHVGHVIPMMLGGSDTRANVAPMCKVCNLVASSKYLDPQTREWVRDRSMQIRAIRGELFAPHAFGFETLIGVAKESR